MVADTSSAVSAQHAEDIAFARAMHGKEIKSGLLSNLASKNADVHNVATDTYLKMWKQPDAENEQDENKRLDSYTALVNSYYNLATDFYEYGWGGSFHFCRYYPGEEFFRAIARHEHYLAANIGIKRGMKVLDVGCGVGGPAREIAEFTGAHITGLNNNAYQVQRAFHYAAKQGLSEQTNFIKGNFMEIPYEDNELDAAYAIEATVHAPTFEGVYGEIFRVLKPGAKFGCYEWCMKDIDQERYADLDSDEESLFDMSEDERDARVEEKRRKKQQQEETSNAFKYEYGHNSPSDLQRKLAAQYKTATDMTLPDTQEQADTIVATAKAAAASVNPKLFEIKTQARQGNNPLYAFLSQRHPLYRFYTHIIWLSSSGLGAYGDSSSSDDDSDDDQPTQPPDEIANIIQKTAQSVARAGQALETRIRQGHGQNPKFGFIHPGHEYHAYYKQQLESFQKNV